MERWRGAVGCMVGRRARRGLFVNDVWSKWKVDETTGVACGVRSGNGIIRVKHNCECQDLEIQM